MGLIFKKIPDGGFNNGNRTINNSAGNVSDSNLSQTSETSLNNGTSMPEENVSYDNTLKLQYSGFTQKDNSDNISGLPQERAFGNTNYTAYPERDSMNRTYSSPTPRRRSGSDTAPNGEMVNTFGGMSSQPNNQAHEDIPLQSGFDNSAERDSMNRTYSSPTPRRRSGSNAAAGGDMVNAFGEMSSQPNNQVREDTSQQISIEKNNYEKSANNEIVNAYNDPRETFSNNNNPNNNYYSQDYYNNFGNNNFAQMNDNNNLASRSLSNPTPRRRSFNAGPNPMQANPNRNSDSGMHALTMDDRVSSPTPRRRRVNLGDVSPTVNPNYNNGGNFDYTNRTLSNERTPIGSSENDRVSSPTLRRGGGNSGTQGFQTNQNYNNAENNNFNNRTFSNERMPVNPSAQNNFDRVSSPTPRRQSTSPAQPSNTDFGNAPNTNLPMSSSFEYFCSSNYASGGFNNNGGDATQGLPTEDRASSPTPRRRNKY